MRVCMHGGVDAMIFFFLQVTDQPFVLLLLTGYSDGSMQTSGQGNPLQQQEQQFTLQQSLTAVSTCDLNNPSSIPASVQYSVPGHHQQQQTMQVYTDQQMTDSHSMSEHSPNSMSVGGLHSITPTEAAMMQDMSRMTQYTAFSMQDPMNTNTMYSTESVSTQIQQPSGVVPQSLGTQYTQITPGPTPTPPPVQGPLELTDNSVTQSVMQNSNAFTSVASFATMEMQSQAGIGMVSYSNSQQSMMVQTQTDMMGGYGVMHNGLLQAQQGVNVMNPTLYGQAGAGNGGNSNGGVGVGEGGTGTQLTGAQGINLMESQQQQEQQQADNFISQQISKHMLQSQLQSHDGHVTPVPGQVTNQQQESTIISALASGEETSTAEVSKAADIKPKVIIVHEDDPTVERFPVLYKSRKTTIEIGIQCELGPETIRSLIEEEKALAAQEQNSEAHGEDDDDEGCQTDEENPNDRTVQKYPCEIENCGKAYIHRKDLIRHMKIRHGKNPSKLEPVTVETREKPFVCPVGHCGRSYYHQKDLRRHQRLCHKVNLETRPTSALKDNVQVDEDCKTQLRYPCDFPGCLRSYVHKKDLVRHKRLYHKDTASKPTIPIPVRYTESELKRIKQEVKMEIDKSIQKIRHDSTGSTAGNATAIGGEGPSNSSLVVEPEAELSSLNSTMDQSSSNLSVSEQPAVGVTLSTPGSTGPQFVLYLDPNNAPTSSTTVVPSASAQPQSSTALFTGSAPCILPTSEALSIQNISKVSAILSSMTASLPQGQAQLDSTSSLIKMATGEQPVDPSLISSEVASILGALEQAQFRQQMQQQQQPPAPPPPLVLPQQQLGGDGSAETAPNTLTNLPADMLSITSFVSTISTPTTVTTPAATVAASVEAQLLSQVTPEMSVSSETVGGSRNTSSILESIESEMSITQGGELADSAVSANPLHQLFSANPSQEPSELSAATERSC